MTLLGLDKMKTTARMESVIVFSVMTLIFLPVRFVFVTFVSDHWFGSFGIISALAVMIVILSKKGKLGKFGEMFQRQMMKIHTGKRRKFIYTNMALSVFIMGLSIVSINLGNTTYVEQKNEILEMADSQGQSLREPADIHQLTEEFHKISTVQLLEALVAMPVLLIYQFPYFTGLMAIENDLTTGFFLHFSTVGFVEVLEMIGVLIFYRVTLKKPAVKL
jgi:hypothetical protein